VLLNFNDFTDGSLRGLLSAALLALSERRREGVKQFLKSSVGFITFVAC